MKNVKVIRDRFGRPAVFYGPHACHVRAEDGDYADFCAWERWMHAQPRTFAADDGFWTWWDATDTDTVSRIDLYVVWPAYRPTLRERVYAILAGWWVRLNAKEGMDAADQS